jgi:hypothetical protein
MLVEFINEGRSSSSLKASFLKLFIIVILSASFKYLSRTIIIKRFLNVPRFIKSSAFLACSSLASYHFKVLIYSIMLRIITSLKWAWLASSMLIYIKVNQVIKLLVIYIELSYSIIIVIINVLLRLSCNVLRILEWTSINTS